MRRATHIQTATEKVLIGSTMNAIRRCCGIFASLAPLYIKLLTCLLIRYVHYNIEDVALFYEYAYDFGAEFDNTLADSISVY